MFAQKVDGRRRVLNCLRLIETLVERECSLPFRFCLISQLNAWLLPPKQIRTKRDKSMCGVPVTNLAHVFIDAKDFLQDDNARAIGARGQSKVAFQLSAIERFKNG